MQQIGPETFASDEGGEGPAPSEQVSDRAREQFAASQAAAKQAQRDEQKARKRDDGVAQVILQFLTDAQKTHYALLIARLVGRDCPSTFLLALLSLINEQCRTAVEEYLREQDGDLAVPATNVTDLQHSSALSVEANDTLARWIVRVEHVMAHDEQTILRTLIVDDQNIDGTILQLTTFILQDFLAQQGKIANFEQVQTLVAGILQTLFRPAMQSWRERRLAEQPADEANA